MLNLRDPELRLPPGMRGTPSIAGWATYDAATSNFNLVFVTAPRSGLELSTGSCALDSHEIQADYTELRGITTDTEQHSIGV